MKKPLTTFDYMKLLLLNVIIAFIIALVSVGFVYAAEFANTDGIDDPNFYKDFNPDNPSKKYQFFAPPEWKQKQNYNVVPLPSHPCNYGWQECNKPRNVTEPSGLLLLSIGTAGLCAWRRYR